MFSGPYSTGKQQWESSEFPVVCERCLGDNPYQRMMKQPFATECKMCARPFTVFRWKPNRKGGYACTTVCLTCAKTRNICQACVLDLVYGMPAHLRDRIQPELSSGTPAPTSGAAREYYADLAERDLREGNVKDFNKAPPKPKLVGIAAAAAPYMMKGGSMPMVQLGASDPNNTTVYLGNLDPLPRAEAIRQQMEQFGAVKEVRLVQGKCAFVEYEQRASAEAAISTGVSVEGHKARLGWARTSQHAKPAHHQQQQQRTQGKKRVPGPPGVAPPPGVAYPSMAGAEEGSQINIK